jgi:prevent-host-death family protein
MPATMIDVDEAAKRLSELLERALNGEEIVLAKRGQPLAKLTPLRPAAKKREMGFAKFSVEPDFDERIMARMEFEWRE